MLVLPVTQKTFHCKFYEIPSRNYTAGSFPTTLLNLDQCTMYTGTLNVDLSTDAMFTGAFKTAHKGMISLDNNNFLAHFAGRPVCVKQVYYDKNGIIGRYSGLTELKMLMMECMCLEWATALLKITDDFVTHELQRLGHPNFPIPKARFIQAMIAMISLSNNKDKSFMIEEWIDSNSGAEFEKYICNCDATPCLADLASPEAHRIAEYLCFAQHVQWVKTKSLAFTSDFQGKFSLPAHVSDCSLNSELMLRCQWFVD
jgi:hypothetical protein